MAKIYRTAMGKSVDIDNILLKNEKVIAMGNMKVNARGDELGPGGRVIKTRDQVMKEYYALNTPVAIEPMDKMRPDEPAATVAKPIAQVAAIVAEQLPINPNSGLDDMDEGPAVAPIIQKTIDEVLREPAPVASTPPVVTAPVRPVPVQSPKATAAPMVADELAPVTTQQTPAIRGSLAGAVAKTATVTQIEKLPPKKANGVQRF